MPPTTFIVHIPPLHKISKRVAPSRTNQGLNSAPHSTQYVALTTWPFAFCYYIDAFFHTYSHLCGCPSFSPFPCSYLWTCHIMTRLIYRSLMLQANHSYSKMLPLAPSHLLILQVNQWLCKWDPEQNIRSANTNFCACRLSCGPTMLPLLSSTDKGHSRCFS